MCVELSLNVPYRLDGIKYDRFELVVAGFADAQNYGCLAVHDSEFSSCHASSLPRSFMGKLGNCAFDQPQLEAVNSRNEAKRQSRSQGKSKRTLTSIRLSRCSQALSKVGGRAFRARMERVVQVVQKSTAKSKKKPKSKKEDIGVGG